MPGYYDRAGKPITMRQWAEALENDRRVDETTLANGLWVSTVWLGIDHRFGMNGPPIIFETMVFSPKRDGSDLDSDRYSTEAEARLGHKRMCEKWTAENPETHS